MIKAILFDMDGTLFDTEAVLGAGWEALVRQGKMPREILSLYPLYCGVSRVEAKKAYLAAFGEDFPIDEMYELRDRYMNEFLDREGVPLKSYVPQIFDRLRERGMRIGLVTSTRRQSVDAHMRRTGFGGYFEHIVSGDRVERSKPAPDIYLLAAREMELLPEECLVVEDSVNGVRSGASAGMRVVMIPDRIQPTEDIRALTVAVCDTLEELPAILDRLNEKR